jgi:hypothetical protein
MLPLDLADEPELAEIVSAVGVASSAKVSPSAVMPPQHAVRPRGARHWTRRSQPPPECGRDRLRASPWG